EIEAMSWVEPLTGRSLGPAENTVIYPATQFVTGKDGVGPIVDKISRDLEDRLTQLDEAGKPLEAQRLASRTRYDMEMIQQIGHCAGVENYSRYFDKRTEGDRPACLLDYFPKDYLMMIDESHATIPQIGAMYHGDRSRKKNLVEHGFRLPSALDNRPLLMNEFEEMMPRTFFISATPADYELEKCGGVVVEQVIRPTGLVDPPIEVLPVANQVDDLLEKIRVVSARGERILVTTLTKKMAEDLTEYFAAAGVKVTYLHSDITALDRIEILRKLRLGEFDVLIGVNLLREGLDLPEVSLVAILDADREGFLRSARSLIQTSGRAARNINGKVIMYADKITRSMEKAISETDRRRKRQEAWNKEHGLVPRTVTKSRDEILQQTTAAGERGMEPAVDVSQPWQSVIDHNMSPQEMVTMLEKEMKVAAKAFEYENAAALRDRIDDLKAQWGIGSGAGQDEL
ncbi:MAG: excinuclease ABC subunit B, partial [Candidatus Krumholzibacteriia bacterium]